MGHVRKSGFEERSCYGETCVFGQFCSEETLYEMCRNCTDLLPWCKSDQDKFRKLFPSCGYICREVNLSEKLRNAETAIRQDGGFDQIDIILTSVCCILLMIFSILVAKECKKRWKQRLAARCGQDQPAANPETDTLMPMQDVAEANDQDPESSPPPHNLDEGFASSTSTIGSIENSQTVPSAPALNLIDETRQGHHNNGNAAAADVPNETRITPTSLPQSETMNYPIQPEDRKVHYDFHVGGAQDPSPWPILG